MRRHKIPLHRSRRMFSRIASRHHPLNMAPPPMRGGIRL